MQFGHPYLLWLLLVIPPAMVAFFWWSDKKRKELLAGFIQARLLPGLLAGVSERRRAIREGCLVLAVCCMILALARPQWGFTWEEVKQRGLDIVVAIDISKSMLAEDIAPNRLARAKLAALDLMQRASTDRLGLVAFAGSAFLQCPLTIDDSVFRQSVESLDVQSVSRGGTAISGAIQAAMGAFTEGDNYKVLVLLTDGEDHDSGALDAARQAAEKGLEIFCIGIGTPEGDLVRAKDASGKVDFIRDEQGNAVKSRLNETILQQLAGVSHRGFYLPLRGAKAIDALYEKGLAPIPKSESGEKLVKNYHERFQWPLGAAILLLIVEMLYPERKRQRTAPAAPQAASAAALMTLALLISAPEGVASVGSASRAYESGDYDSALNQYKELLRKGKEDPRLHFNAGAAAYKDKQLEEAANQFNQALASQDLKLQQQAFYNRGNTFYALGEASPDPSHKSEAWEKSIKDFESALKLNPKDGDAAFNRDVVKRKLEELKQQQQQQEKQQQNKDDQKQDQKDQQQQQQKQDQQQQNKDQQQKQDQKQNQQEQKDQSQRNQQQPSDDQKKDQEKQQDQPKPGEQEKKEEKKPSQADQQKEQPSGQEQQQQQQTAPEGQMTPEQARQLLDAEKGEEKVLQFRPEEKPMDSSRPFKDW